MPPSGASVTSACRSRTRSMVSMIMCSRGAGEFLMEIVSSPSRPRICSARRAGSSRRRARSKRRELVSWIHVPATATGRQGATVNACNECSQVFDWACDETMTPFGRSILQWTTWGTPMSKSRPGETRKHAGPLRTRSSSTVQSCRGFLARFSRNSVSSDSSSGTSGGRSCPARRRVRLRLGVADVWDVDEVAGRGAGSRPAGARSLEGLNLRVEPATKRLVDAGPAPRRPQRSSVEKRACVRWLTKPTLPLSSAAWMQLATR